MCVMHHAQVRTSIPAWAHRVMARAHLCDDRPPVPGGHRREGLQSGPDRVEHGRAALVPDHQVLRVGGHVVAVVRDAHVADLQAA